ncbi:MAG: VTT domain-containing protein [Candidatus Sumerlaeota bacterium]|nr:VTT domain-containing protein [Candidatus Sumerlaeota bacterium]
MIIEWGWVAYIVLFFIIFAETGLLAGFCLPGDSLLFVAGFVCAIEVNNQRVLNIFVLVPLLMVAAVVGDNVNYMLGRHTGPLIFSRENSLLFHKKHLVRTQHFYEKYGGRTIVYARFVPIVRTFAPFVAGMGKMKFQHFFLMNVMGGTLWIISMTVLGYYLGQIPAVKNNLEKAVILVILLSMAPLFIEIWRARREKKRLALNSAAQ